MIGHQLTLNDPVESEICISTNNHQTTKLQVHLYNFPKMELASHVKTTTKELHQIVSIQIKTMHLMVKLQTASANPWS